VNYGAQGVNRVGILSGNVVHVSGASFVNEAFYLDAVVYVRRQSHYETDCWDCSKTHYYASASTEEDWARMDPDSPSYDPGYYLSRYNPALGSDPAAMAASLTKESSRPTYKTMASAYVYANTLNVTGGSATNSGSARPVTTTSTSSTIQSGGNMSIAAKGDATFVGATVESGGNLDVSAKSITNKAAQDTQEKTTSSSSHLAGVYIGTAAQANVAAEANLSASTGVVVGGGAGHKDKSDSKGSTTKAGDSTAAGSKATASTAKTGSDDKTAAAKDSGGLLDETGLKADASASAEATAGLRYQNKQESETEGSVTQVTNSFTAKGSITRTATDTITDQGTQMEAGKNINQTARVINDEAVSDSTYSSKDAQSHDARVGAYAGASASASASVEGKASVTGKVESEKPEVEAGASAGLGVKVSYTAASLPSRSPPPRR